MLVKVSGIGRVVTEMTLGSPQSAAAYGSMMLSTEDRPKGVRVWLGNIKHYVVAGVLQ